MSEAYSLPMNAKSLLGSVMARESLSLTHGDGGSILSEYADRQGFLGAQVRTLGADVTSFTSVVVEDVGSVAWKLKGGEDLSKIWGDELLSLEKENTSDFKRQNTIGKTTNSGQAVDDNDVTHAKMVEFEPLLKALGERNGGVDTVVPEV